jgi:hypothetical protein
MSVIAYPYFVLALGSGWADLHSQHADSGIVPATANRENPRLALGYSTVMHRSAKATYSAAVSGTIRD